MKKFILQFFGAVIIIAGGVAAFQIVIGVGFLIGLPLTSEHGEISSGGFAYVAFVIGALIIWLILNKYFPSLIGKIK